MTHAEALMLVALARSGRAPMPDIDEVHAAYQEKFREILRDASANRRTVMALLGKGQVDVFTKADRLFQARPRMVSSGSDNDIRMILICQALLVEISEFCVINAESDLVAITLFTMALAGNTSHFLWPEAEYAEGS